MTHTKLCGLTRETDLDAAIAASADMVGFVCDVPIETSRELTPARAAELVTRVPESVTSTLVTMPATPEAGTDLVETVGPDAVQVHGCSPEEVGALRERTGIPIFAGVDAANDDLGQYAAAADALVLDSTDKHGAGGTGETHDWQQAGHIVSDLDMPVLLAGGLTPTNVAEAVRVVEPFGVDVSSGIEESGGVKNQVALRRFVERATAQTVRA